MTAIVIAAAAALGALSRYAVEKVLPNGQDGTHYIGTLTVNLTGALVIGILTGALTPRFAEHPPTPKPAPRRLSELVHDILGAGGPDDSARSASLDHNHPRSMR